MSCEVRFTKADKLGTFNQGIALKMARVSVFQTRFLRSDLVAFPRSLAAVHHPGELGRWAAKESDASKHIPQNALASRDAKPSLRGYEL